MADSNRERPDRIDQQDVIIDELMAQQRRAEDEPLRDEADTDESLGLADLIQIRRNLSQDSRDDASSDEPLVAARGDVAPQTQDAAAIDLDPVAVRGADQFDETGAPDAPAAPDAMTLQPGFGPETDIATNTAKDVAGGGALRSISSERLLAEVLARAKSDFSLRADLERQFADARWAPARTVDGTENDVPLVSGPTNTAPVLDSISDTAVGEDSLLGGGAGDADVIDLTSLADGQLSGGWLTLSIGSLENSGDDFSVLSGDVAGTISLQDGTTITFEGIERLDF